MSAFDNISVEKKETLAYLTVNRPKALNALNKATLAEIGTAAFMGKRLAQFIGR